VGIAKAISKPGVLGQAAIADRILRPSPMLV
jgi:hypothetical protein